MPVRSWCPAASRRRARSGWLAAVWPGCSARAPRRSAPTGPAGRRSPGWSGRRRPARLSPVRAGSAGSPKRLRMYANLDQPNLSPRTTGWENAAMTASTGRLTALQASWLFDGTGSALISDPVVLIEGSTIRGVSSGGSPPRGATVIDLSGATLLPGLVDTHVHLAFDTSADAVGNLARRQDGEV